MRASSSSRRFERTKLGAFLRDYITTQMNEGSLTKLASEVSERAGTTITPQYINQVELGKIGTPKREFLAALAQLTGKDQRELERMAIEPASHSMSAEFRLLFGHTLWAAPIFLAAHRGRVQSFEVASLAEADAQQNPDTSRIAWIKPNQIAGGMAGIAKADEASKSLLPLSANQVFEVVDSGACDLAALPGNIIQQRDPFGKLYTRIGKVVDSAAGCVLVFGKSIASALKMYFSKSSNSNSGHQASAVKTINTHELANVLKLLQKKRVGVELSTITAEFLQDACQYVRTDYRKLLWNAPSREQAYDGFKTLATRCLDATKCELAGIITMEPHATWLMQHPDSSNERLDKVALTYHPSPRGCPRHFSFDVIVSSINEKRNDPDFRLAVKTLMKQMWIASLDIGKDEVDHDVARRIAWYFGLAMPNALADIGGGWRDTVTDALGSIRYSVCWEMDALTAFFPEIPLKHS